MTCLMRAAARGRRAARPRTWLLARTRAVAALRAPRVRGTRRTWMEPLIIVPGNCDSGPGACDPVQADGGWGGLSSLQGLGPAPESFVFVMTSRRPSGETSTSAGYQAV